MIMEKQKEQEMQVRLSREVQSLCIKYGSIQLQSKLKGSSIYKTNHRLLRLRRRSEGECELRRGRRPRSEGEFAHCRRRSGGRTERTLKPGPGQEKRLKSGSNKSSPSEPKEEQNLRDDLVAHFARLNCGGGIVDVFRHNEGYECVEFVNAAALELGLKLNRTIFNT